MLCSSLSSKPHLSSFFSGPSLYSKNRRQLTPNVTQFSVSIESARVEQLQANPQSLLSGVLIEANFLVIGVLKYEPGLDLFFSLIITFMVSAIMAGRVPFLHSPVYAEKPQLEKGYTHLLKKKP